MYLFNLEINLPINLFQDISSFYLLNISVHFASSERPETLVCT